MERHCHVVVHQLTEHEILTATKSSKRCCTRYSSQTSFRKKKCPNGVSSHSPSKKKGTKKSSECDNKSQQLPAFRANFLSNYKIPKLVPEATTSSDPSSSNIKSSHQNELSSQNSNSSSIMAYMLKGRWKNKGISKRCKYEKKYRDIQLFVKQIKWTHVHDSTLPKSQHQQACARCLLKMIISSEELTFRDKTHKIKRILKKFSSQYPLKKSLVLDGIVSKNKSATRIIPSNKFSKEFQSTKVDGRIEKTPNTDFEAEEGVDNVERNFNSVEDTVKVTPLNKNESYNTENWTQILPTVLLGLRAVVRPDTNYSVAQMIYGTNIKLPGEFFDPPTKKIEPESFVTQLQDFMLQVKPSKSSSHANQKIFVSQDLNSCSSVFVRTDRVRKSLEPPYEGPFLVQQRTPKYFTLLIKGKPVNISIDRLKPAYILDQPNSDKLPSLPSTTESNNPKSPPKLPENIDKQKVSDSNKLQTRCGRKITKPVRFNDFIDYPT